jgi:hypothetical protein
MSFLGRVADQLLTQLGDSAEVGAPSAAFHLGVRLEAFLPDDVIGAVADFFIDPPHVLPDDPQHQHDQTADDENGDHQRGPAGEWRVTRGPAQDDRQCPNEPKTRSDDPEHGDEPDREVRGVEGCIDEVSGSNRLARKQMTSSEPLSHFSTICGISRVISRACQRATGWCRKRPCVCYVEDAPEAATSRCGGAGDAQ